MPSAPSYRPALKRLGDGGQALGGPRLLIPAQGQVLHDGAIIESGETRPVLTRPEHPVTAAMCEAGAEETIDGALAAAGAAA